MYRRRTNLAAWFLEELQYVIIYAVAAGVRFAFSDKRLWPASSAGEFAQRVPRFDLAIDDEEGEADG